MSSVSPSTDSRDGERGGVKGNGKGKKGRAKGNKRGSAPSTSGGEKRVYKRDGNGHKDVGDHLCKPWNNEVKRIMEKNKKMASAQVKAWKGTFTDSKGRISDTMTYLRLRKILVEGLTGDGEGQLEIVPEKVFFRRDSLPSLKKWYNLNSKYNPVDIGVVLDETCVKIDGVVYTVGSLEDGWYSLNGSDIKIKQWELLESRCGDDGGAHDSLVTLDEDLKIYIRSLINDHEDIWRSFVPYLRKGQKPKRGVAKIRTDTVLKDVSKGSAKVRGYLSRVANMRRLSKLAFINTSVADCFHTLPVRATSEGDDGHDAAKSLRDFSHEEGSLCKLNGLDGIDEPSVERDEIDAKNMVNVSGEEKHGSYMNHINHALRVLQYSYRLNRPVSLHEAFFPLCTHERKVLRKHFPWWEKNESDEEDFFPEPFRIHADPEKMTIAMRFSLERCSEVLPTLSPTMIKILSRDNKRLGPLCDGSNHTGATAFQAKALCLVDFIMGGDLETGRHNGMRKATKEELSLVHANGASCLQRKRTEADKEEKANGGTRGPAKKDRKGKVPFSGKTIEQAFGEVEFLFEGMYRNGMKKVLDAIDAIDGTCTGKGGWCYSILESAQVASQNNSKRAKFKEDQLQGTEEQKKKIDLVVQGLRERKINGKHFELASAAAGVFDAFSSASLRNQGFFFREALRTCVESEEKSRNLGRMVAGLPGKNKNDNKGGGGGGVAAQEHVIDVNCGEWYAVMIVIGRPFYRSLGGYPGQQSPYIGPLDAAGGAMPQKRFNAILGKLGRAYLGVENLTFNQLRTALCSIVIAECIKLGVRMDDPVIADFASSILTSVQVCTRVLSPCTLIVCVVLTCLNRAFLQADIFLRWPCVETIVTVLPTYVREIPPEFLWRMLIFLSNPSVVYSWHKTDDADSVQHSPGRDNAK